MAAMPVLSSSTQHVCTEFSGGTAKLDCGCFQVGQEAEVHEQMHAGLKLVVVDGRLRYRSEAMAREEDASGPTVFLMSDDGRHGGSQTFVSGIEQRYVVLRLAPQWIVAELGQDPGDLHRRLGGAVDRPVVRRRPAERSVSGLASQILHGPSDGPLRRLRLGSQVLALALQVMAPWLDGVDAQSHAGLRGTELERLHHARGLLLADLRQPPSLTQLATAVGMSVRRLDAGFRQVFGVSPAGYLREQRLRQAWHWLASGQFQVSEVAWMSGYGFAHFSTAFRRRFGVSPTDLRAH